MGLGVSNQNTLQYYSCTHNTSKKGRTGYDAPRSNFVPNGYRNKQQDQASDFFFVAPLFCFSRSCSLCRNMDMKAAHTPYDDVACRVMGIERGDTIQYFERREERRKLRAGPGVLHTYVGMGKERAN